MRCELAPSARVGKRDGEGLELPDVLKFLRIGETWLQNIKFHIEDRHLQGYEDDLDVLVNALKKSDKTTKIDHTSVERSGAGNVPDAATWRQKKLECCEEGRAPPGKPKTKHLNWERVFGGPERSL